MIDILCCSGDYKAVNESDVISIKGRQSSYELRQILENAHSRGYLTYRLKFDRHVRKGGCLKSMLMLITSFPCFGGTDFSIYLGYLVYDCSCCFHAVWYIIMPQVPYKMLVLLAKKTKYVPEHHPKLFIPLGAIQDLFVCL